ncbi:hypothetical protein B0H11DRAFT_1848258 [Mycena galericulata]|nr:hypothetical protein B0H11DRAFT_1848258 [Mycena galericulata]
MRYPTSRTLPAFVLNLALALTLSPSPARANTEIINFPAPARPDSDAALLRSAAHAWPTLAPQSTTEWTLVPAPLGTPPSELCAPVSVPSGVEAPCAHELWVVLDLDSTEHAYAKYTLRLSWAASMPTDFYMDVLDPEEAAALALTPTPESKAKANAHAPLTRRKYARIRAVDAGVRTPRVSSSPPDPPAQVDFHLTLEPLLLGVLPASLLPFLLVAGAVLAAVGTALPAVLRFFAGLVEEVRREGKEKGE